MHLGNKRSISALRQVLEPLASQTRVIDTLDGPVLLLMSAEHVYELKPIWAGEGYPRDVKVALDLTPLDGLAPSQTPVVVASNMSRGAQAYLDERNMPWADEHGRAHIVARPALLVHAGASRKVAVSRPGVRWSPSAGAVAELVLTHISHERRSVAHPALSGVLPPNSVLAAGLPVSSAQVSKVLQRFDVEGWTRKSGAQRGPAAERHLEDPSGLLSSWAAWQAHRRLPAVRTHATWQDPEDFLADRLAPALPSYSWCVTGWLAANRLAPFTTSVPNITCYVEPEVFDHGLGQVVEEAGLRRVESGARVTFLRAEPQVLTLARRMDVPIASDVRIYADLLAAGARGEDAADHLREVLIGY